MRTASGIRTASSPSTPVVQQERYNWLPSFLPNAQYQNKTNFWVVIVGAGFSKSGADLTLFIQVPADGGGFVTIDAMTIVTGSLVYTLERRMIVPPNGLILSTAGSVSMVQCRSLGDALAIL